MKSSETPKWFLDALAQKPDIKTVKIKGSKISYNCWGEKNKPGLIFVHGGMAHADWWNFITPYFLKTHRVIAMNLGGMGDSEWRKEYSTETWGLEIEGVCKNYPDHSVLGEEESILGEREYEWCIDPIDGTKSFIQGVPLWGTLISLAKNKKIILGLADIPALDERYIGYSDKSYKFIKGKKKLLNVRRISNLDESILNTTSPYVFANKSDQKSFERLSKKVKSTRLGGDCYSYCLLADGHVDIVVESGLKPWDIRALEPIIKNAGGIIKTWENKNVFNGGRIIACNNKTLFKNSRSLLIK